jgi:predicted nucleotidyltransferase
MDFVKVIPLITGEFEKEKIEYALMGGFAMGAIGVIRATADLDFVVNAKDLAKIEAIMEKYGYRCVYKSENISQYVSDIKIFGEIDFLHAFRPVSAAMLKRAVTMPIIEGRHTIKVLKPEDIIGLKLQAAVNNPGRKNREYVDIAMIMEHYRQKLDWRLLGEYFRLFNKGKDFKILKERYGKVK